jgi:hypothetical protein
MQNIYALGLLGLYKKILKIYSDNSFGCLGNKISEWKEIL